MISLLVVSGFELATVDCKYSQICTKCIFVVEMYKYPSKSTCILNYPSDELSLSQLICIVRSYVELLYHFLRLGGGLVSR